METLSRNYNCGEKKNTNKMKSNKRMDRIDKNLARGGAV